MRGTGDRRDLRTGTCKIIKLKGVVNITTPLFFVCNGVIC